jgi:hypothetical protein
VFSFDGLKTVFASSELYSPATSPAKRGDRFTEDGFTYEIRTVNKKGKLIPHWHCTASIVDPNT